MNQAAAGRPTRVKNTGFKFEDTLKTPKHPNPTTASSNKAVLLPQIFTNKPFLDAGSARLPKSRRPLSHRVLVIQVIEISSMNSNFFL